MSAAAAAAVEEVPFYSVDDCVNDSIDDYDAVLFTVCDIHGVARGRMGVGEGVRSLTNHGVEVPHYICALGFKSETPTNIPRYNRTSGVTSKLRPDLSTLKPIGWLCDSGRKAGHVLCDLYDSDGQQDLTSPRAIATKQIEALKSAGYHILSAFEAEFFIFHKNTLDAIGGNAVDLASINKLNGEMEIIYDLTLELLASGVPVETHMKELDAGQVEFSMQPQYGVKMADAIHRLRYITKSFCARNGYDTTFMTRPKMGCSSGFHFNHSIWTLDGQNAFLDPCGDHLCSEFMFHWIAGLIHHGDALMALTSPTVNCFERLHQYFSPGDNVWNYDDRNARIRVKNKRSNVYVEERAASSACNPYLVMAGIIAAGLDGVANQMECPPNRDFRPLIADDERAKEQNPLPFTLEDALIALEKDSALNVALGETFIQEYVAMSREFQVDKLMEVKDKGPEEKYQAYRDLYLKSL